MAVEPFDAARPGRLVCVVAAALAAAVALMGCGPSQAQLEAEKLTRECVELNTPDPALEATVHNYLVRSKQEKAASDDLADAAQANLDAAVVDQNEAMLAIAAGNHPVADAALAAEGRRAKRAARLTAMGTAGLQGPTKKEADALAVMGLIVKLRREDCGGD